LGITNEYLNNLPDGAVVDIPIDSPVVDDMWANINAKFSRQIEWGPRVRYLAENWDKEKLLPVYYCQTCGVVEDATHRMAAAKILGIETLPLTVGRECWKQRREVHRLSTTPFKAAIEEARTGNSQDTLWVDACSIKKWFRFGPRIDWSGKTVLDIGCQCGYSVYQACKYGAREAIGWDTRAQILKAAELVRPVFPNAPAIFKHKNFLTDMADAPQVDVVMCLGCAHYFPEADYERGIRGLFNHSDKWVILELRQCKKDGPTPIYTSQSIATKTWLSKTAESMGFGLFDYWEREKESRPKRKDLRAIWIFRIQERIKHDR